MLILLALFAYAFGMITQSHSGKANGALAPAPPAPPSPHPLTPPPGHGPVELTGDTIALTPKAQYLALVQLTGLQSAFGTKGAVQAKLGELGFNPVSVWNANPPEIFPIRTPFPSGSTYWAAGTYASMPQQVKRQDPIKNVWLLPASAPAPAASPIVSGVELAAMTREEKIRALQDVAYSVRQSIEALLESEPSPES